jgi:hypothetical protein
MFLKTISPPTEEPVTLQGSQGTSSSGKRRRRLSLDAHLGCPASLRVVPGQGVRHEDVGPLPGRFPAGMHPGSFAAFAARRVHQIQGRFRNTTDARCIGICNGRIHRARPNLPCLWKALAFDNPKDSAGDLEFICLFDLNIQVLRIGRMQDYSTRLEQECLHNGGAIDPGNDNISPARFF